MKLWFRKQTKKKPQKDKVRAKSMQTNCKCFIKHIKTELLSGAAFELFLNIL
jgi:hypothetical protein